MKAAAPKREAPAPIDFEPWDINGTCPIPTRAEWIEAADVSLPWLRLGFVLMCDSKADLGRKLCEMERKDFDPIIPALKLEADRFRQIADMAEAVLARCIVAMEAHVAPVDEEPARG